MKLRPTDGQITGVFVTRSGLGTRIQASLYRWRWVLWSGLVAMIAIVTWAYYYRHRAAVCFEQKTNAACGRLVVLESWACEHGIGESILVGGCFAVGARYQSGAGVPKDEQQATAFFRRACVYEWGRGCTMAWVAYSEALGTPHYVVAWGGPTGPIPSPAYLPQWARDLNEVLDQADRLCATDFRDGVIGSPEHHKLLRTLCDDLPRARAARDDANAGYPWLLAKCERENPRACGLAGQILTYGIGVRRNLDRGKTLLLRACSAGYELMCNDLGPGPQSDRLLDNLERAEKLVSSVPN